MQSLKNNKSGWVKKGSAQFGRTTVLNTTIANNAPIPFGESTYFNNSYNISLLSTTQIKLKANVTYFLIADVGLNLTDGAIALYYRFYNVTTASLIGTPALNFSPTYTVAPTASSEKPTVYITPTVDTIIELRITTNSANYIYPGANVRVEELETQTLAVPKALDMMVGVNQKWTDVTSSRVVGTTYTNTTGKPIQVIVGITSSIAGTQQATINGIITYGATALANAISYSSFIVPNGGTYNVIRDGGGTQSLVKWSELR